MPIDPLSPRAFARNEEGAAAVIVALLLVALLSFVALGVDLAVLYRNRAHLQAQSDLVAMGAVADVWDAEARGADMLQGNDLAPETLVELQTGRYLRNPAIPRDQRFQPLPADAAGLNAVAVRLRDDAPLSFGRILTDQTSVPVSGMATATRTGGVSFSLESNLLRVDGATLAALFSDSFGLAVTLNAYDLQLLAETQISLGTVIEAAAERVGADPLNPADILALDLRAADLIRAIQQVAPAAIGSRLIPFQSIPATLTVNVGDLVATTDRDLGLTLTDFAQDLEISVLDMLVALAEATAPDAPRSVAVSQTVPGVTQVTAQAIFFEPPAQSGWIMLGEVGATLHSADARIRADITLAPDTIGALGTGITATRVSLPLIAEVAGATATLTDLRCSGAAPDDIVARFSTAQRPLSPTDGSAVAAIYLGRLDPAVFASGAPINPADLAYADFLDLTFRIDLPILPDIVIPGLTLQIRGVTRAGQSQSAEVAFTRAQVAAGDTTRTFASGAILGTSLGDLLASDQTDIRVQPAEQGLVSTLAAPIVNAVINLLPGRMVANLVAPLDGALDAVLDAAGIRFGEGALTLEQHHCETVRLVQ